MSSALLKFIHRESGRGKALIASASFASGLARGALLTTINAAVALAAEGRGYAGYAVLFALLMLVYLGTRYYAELRTHALLAQMVQRLRLRLCRRLLATDLRFIEARGSGELFAHIAHDIGEISGATVTLINVLQQAVLLLFCLAYVGWLSVPGLLVTLFTMVVSITLYLKREAMIRPLLVEHRENQLKFFDAIGDLLTGFKELKLNRRRRADISAYIDDVAEQHRRLLLRTEDASLRTGILTQLMTFVLLGVLVFVIPVYSDIGAVAVFQFLAAILFMIGPLEAVVGSIPAFNRANVALDRLARLDEQMAIAVHEDAADVDLDDVAPLDFTSLRLREVSYSFVGGASDDRFMLGPLDLELRRNEILFIVGGNGAGKTTLLKLLTGLYPPDAGWIEVDGQALAASDRQRYRELFATVFSNFHLFRIPYGIGDPDPDTIAGLLEELELQRKIHFADGRFSSLSLSTGQRKRLAYLIARLENRHIYVFDEFGADQDPQFRRLFYHHILPEMKRQGKTVVAVTHDDHFFDCCDRLVKLDYGRVDTVPSDAFLPAAGRRISE